MADGEKRIVELTETQTFGNGDYLPLDNISNSETKKIEAKKLGITYTMTDTEDGFSFDGSNGYHYEKVIPKDAQMSYDDYEDLTEAEKMDGSNRFIPDYPEEEKQPEIWTRVGRTPLTTDAKTISPAINELDAKIKALIDVFYPVGSYYETDDTTFDPNAAWGGTWVLETEGLVHISSGTNYSVSSNAQDGGEKTHKLTIAEMPKHNHKLQLTRNGQYYDAVWYAGYTAGTARASINYNETSAGAVPYITQAGSDTAHNNMQPYKIVNRWHRTA